MQDQTIKCPSCGSSIPLSETLTHQIRDEIERGLKEQLNREKEEFIHKEKAKMWALAQQKAQEKMQSELKEKEEQIGEQKKKLEELEKHELELRRQKRELEEQRRKLELDVERRVDEIRKQTVEKLQKDLEEQHRFKLLEKDKQMEQMRKTIEELKRKSEQGSQQVQGDALESDIKTVLQTHFPIDTIIDVPTGITGADLIHTVNTQHGAKAGVILWEIKNTKAFNVEWITKLKDDQTKAKADMCILVTKVLPEGIKAFGEVKGVIVVEFGYAIAVAHVLRDNIMTLAKMKQSIEGSGKKMEFLYQYLLSPEFKNKIESIISAFTSLKFELEREKRAMTAIWSRREKEIERVLTSTSSLYGDLQGATGDALPKIEKLELADSLLTEDDQLF